MIKITTTLHNLNLTCGNVQKLVASASCSVLKGFHIVLFCSDQVTNFKTKPEHLALSGVVVKEGMISCSSHHAAEVW